MPTTLESHTLQLYGFLCTIYLKSAFRIYFKAFFLTKTVKFKYYVIILV